MSTEGNAGPWKREERRVLIVDDEKDFILSLEDILESRGYRVEKAHSRQTACEKIKHFDAQVALLDIRLGRDDGINLIAKLGKARPGIVCVMMTAYAAIDTAVRALQGGAYDYLRKPFEASELLANLDRCFEKIRLENEKAAAEQALRKSEKRFEQVAENAEEWIWEVAADGLYTYASPIVEKILGYKPEELVGREHFYDLFHPESRERLKRGAFEVFAKKQSFREFANRNVHKNGKTVWLSTSGIPILDEKGNLLGYRGVDTDITARKRAEEALAREHNLLRTLIDNLPDYIYFKDAECRFLLGNIAVAQIMGAATPDDLIGRTDFDFYPQELAAQYYADEQEVIRSGCPQFNREEPIIDPSGNRTWILTTQAPLQDSQGVIVGLVGISRDITERKRVEAEREALIVELEAKNAELERFTYTVSHDLKSPLITIRGFLGLLEQDAVKGDLEQLRTDIQYICEATDTMYHLLDDLLELSRIGRLLNPPQEMPFGDLAQEAVERVAGQIAECGVHVTIRSDLPTVYGDRLRLVGMLQNLIENAIKFMGDRSDPQIDIGAKPGEDGPVLYVADNGIGIDPRYHDKVFGLFERLDPAVTGTGVGLALAKRIIEVHGGRIWVESAGPGRGSTFYFTLAPKGD